MSALDERAGAADDGATDEPSVAAMLASAAPEAIGELAADAKNSVLPKDPLGAKIESLRKEQQDLKAQKKRLQKDLRNAERKKKRLSERARKLSDKDLVSVLLMRKNQREMRLAAENEVGAKCPGGAVASSTASSGSRASAA